MLVEQLDHTGQLLHSALDEVPGGCQVRLHECLQLVTSGVLPAVLAAADLAELPVRWQAAQPASALLSWFEGSAHAG